MAFQHGGDPELLAVVCARSEGWGRPEVMSLWHCPHHDAWGNKEDWRALRRRSQVFGLSV